MAAFLGDDGAVSIGGVLLAEIRKFSINQSSNRVEAPKLGLSNKRFLAGKPEVTGSIELNYDPAEEAAGGALIGVDVGDDVVIVAYPRGVGVGLPRITVTVALTDTTLEFEFDGVMPNNFSFAASGTLTKDIQS